MLSLAIRVSVESHRSGKLAETSSSSQQNAIALCPATAAALLLLLSVEETCGVRSFTEATTVIIGWKPVIKEIVVVNLARTRDGIMQLKLERSRAHERSNYYYKYRLGEIDPTVWNKTRHCIHTHTRTEWMDVCIGRLDGWP